MHCTLEFKFSFTYRTELENGLTEHEFDHVYFGVSDDVPIPNPQEVKAWKYMSLPALKKELIQYPERYSAWLKICLAKVSEYRDQKPQI